MPKLVAPHGGGGLRPLLLEDDVLTTEKEYAASLPEVVMLLREVGDVIMMGIGGFESLKGFMAKDLAGAPYTYGRLA